VCYGCPEGTVGAPGACAPCADNRTCPGLLSAPLINFSAATGLESVWAACPRLAPQPQRLSPQAGLNFYAVAPILAGLALLFFWTLFAAIFVRPPPGAETTLLARLLRGADLFSMQHDVKEAGYAMRLSTPLGGACSLLALTVALTYAAYLAFLYATDNTLVARSLDALSAAAWGAAAPLPWAPLAALPGGSALPPRAALAVRLTVSGEPGACGTLQGGGPLWAGLASGAWVALPPLPACGADGGARVAQHTLACVGCAFTPRASLSLLLHYSCQTALVEAAAAPPYPRGALSVVSAAVAASGAGGHLRGVEWDVGPLFSVQWDNVSAANSAKGYELTRSDVALRRAALAPAAAGGGGGGGGGGAPLLTIQPLGGAVNYTLLLPLASTYTVTVLTQRVPWTQLLANIVGLSGVLGLFGSLFSVCEKRLGEGGPSLAVKGEPPPPAERPPPGARQQSSALRGAAMGSPRPTASLPAPPAQAGGGGDAAGGPQRAPSLQRPPPQGPERRTSAARKSPGGGGNGSGSWGALRPEERRGDGRSAFGPRAPPRGGEGGNGPPWLVGNPLHVRRGGGVDSAAQGADFY
jgi:hypothetical protein